MVSIRILLELGQRLYRKLRLEHLLFELIFIDEFDVPLRIQ